VDSLKKGMQGRIRALEKSGSPDTRVCPVNGIVLILIGGKKKVGKSTVTRTGRRGEREGWSGGKMFL